MTDLRTRIAAIIETHDPCGLPGGIDCSCGQGFRPDSGSWVERGVEANRLWSEHLADAVIRELLAGYVLVPKNVTLFEWADPVFMGQEEGQFKHERITEWEPTDD